MDQHRAQEFGRHFEMAVGREFGLAGEPHMVQHEDCADAGEDRSQKNMRAGEIQRTQASADHIVAELLHHLWQAGCAMCCGTYRKTVEETVRARSGKLCSGFPKACPR